MFYAVAEYLALKGKLTGYKGQAPPVMLSASTGFKGLLPMKM